MPTQNMHPPLSQLLPLETIPDEFEGIHEAIENVFASLMPVVT